MCMALKHASKEWYQKFYVLMDDPYIRRKYNRDARIDEKCTYIQQHACEILENVGKVVCDLGPGPGEFLELVKHFGHTAIGIDARLDDCEMGDKYIVLSHLLVARQKLNVWYVGFENLLDQPFLPFKENSIFFLNSQGSIEQVFKRFLNGPPHRETKNANLLSWNICQELETILQKFLCECYRVLEVGGILLIYGNGAQNVIDYDTLFKKCVKRISNFEIIDNIDYRFHKVRKVL